MLVCSQGSAVEMGQLYASLQRFGTMKEYAGHQSATRGHTQRAEAEPTSARLKIALILRSVPAGLTESLVSGLIPIPLTQTTERVVLLSSDGQGRAPAHCDVPELQAGGASVTLPV